MQIDALGSMPLGPQVYQQTTAQPPPAVGNANSGDSFGLEFESLLQIVLTQLTYQDPLKPMENFEFVSQLAQFSQIQQGEEINNNLGALVSAQATSQAASLLGRTVDFSNGQGQISGVVKAISFTNGAPTLTVETEQGATISSVALSNVVQIRETE